jgi:dUTP pyrophosphatase
MEPIKVKFKKLCKEAEAPKYAHPGEDMAMDLKAISVEYDAKKDAYIYHTGLAFESPKNTGSFLFVRSSNSKTDCYLANHVGLADIAGYRGEIMLVFKNRTALDVRNRVNQIGWLLDNAINGKIQSYSQSDIAKSIVEAGDLNPMDYAPYEVGDRIAQMMIVEYKDVELEECEELSDSSRGTTGFGASGK